MGFLEWLRGMTSPEPEESNTPWQPIKEHVKPVVSEMNLANLDSQQLYQTIQDKQNLAEATNLRQREAKVEIPTELPVTVFMVSDIHHGSVFTNENMWRSHKEQIEETP